MPHGALTSSDAMATLPADGTLTAGTGTFQRHPADRGNQTIIRHRYRERLDHRHE